MNLRRKKTSTQINNFEAWQSISILAAQPDIDVCNFLLLEDEELNFKAVINIGIFVSDL